MLEISGFAMVVAPVDDEKQPDMNTEEIERRRDRALLRALSTPHKKQSEMKLGKQRSAPKAKASRKKSANDGA